MERRPGRENAAPEAQLTSPWVAQWAHLIPPAGRVLDVACGRGRHTRLLAERAYAVEAVDRDAAALRSLAPLPGVTRRVADLENEPWAYAAEAFAGIVVTNYLHRPLMPRLIEALAPGGVLIYETFAIGNERLGRPANPNFLLLPGELLEAVRGRLRVIAYEDVRVSQPGPAQVQRICAMRPRRDAPRRD